MKLDPRLEELLDKEGNTEAEIEEIKNHDQVKDVQNVGFGNSVHPEFEQINIIIEDYHSDGNDQIFYNYLLKDEIPIQAYKCPDGTIFEDKKEAMEYTKNYHIKRKLEKFCEENCTYGMDKQDVLNTLLENLDELKKIFRGQ